MPEMAAAFMDDVNIKGLPTFYETTEDRWYTSAAFTELLPQPHLASCALGVDDLFYEVTAENSGIHCFVHDHVNDMNRIESFNSSKRLEGHSPGGRWTFVFLKWWPLVTNALMGVITLKIKRFRRYWTGQTAPLSWKSVVSWVYAAFSGFGSRTLRNMPGCWLC